MNKKLMIILLSGLLVFGMVGCKDKSTDSEVLGNETNGSSGDVVENSGDNSINESSEEGKESEENSSISSKIVEGLANLEDKSALAMIEYVDNNIQSVDKQTADTLVISILKQSFSELDLSNSYMYGVESLEVNDAINLAVTEHQDKFNGKFYMGKNEIYMVDESIKNSTIKKSLKELFSRGHGLVSAEGSYYATVDYPSFYEKYSKYVSESLSDYLNLASTEVQEPTMVEEYLAISIEELEKRVISYETFLKNHKDFQFEGEVRILYMSALWKVINPNVFDNMLDENFRVRSEVMSMYNKFKNMDDYPVLQHASKGILEFINSREDGVVCTFDNMDDLFDASYRLQDEVGSMIDKLYIDN